jgi:rare lipoprotein A
MKMIKQNHFPNVAAVTTLFVMLLTSNMALAKKPVSKTRHVSVIEVHSHNKGNNLKVIDKNSKLSKHNINKPGATPRAYKATGMASWYGYQHKGKVTAMGTRFNPMSLTAAHRTLPLPSKVRVTNLMNHKSVVVMITDRGPYAKGRLIDLSLASARAIGIDGVGKVEVEVIN